VNLTFSAVLVLAAALSATLLCAQIGAQSDAQNPPPTQPPAEVIDPKIPPPPPPGPAPATARAASPNGEPIDARIPPPPPPEEPRFDPLRAEKSVEVGLFYMRKKDYDAALERFQDAAKAKPGFAKPYELMGDAYEKKGMRAEAVKSYEAFIKIVPSSPDAERLRKRIEKLNEEIAKDPRKHAS
jgi:tetratricopeptide (TPR) repeat protein